MTKAIAIAIALALLAAPALAQTLPPELQAMQNDCLKLQADITAAQAAVAQVQADIAALATAQSNLPQTATESLEGAQVTGPGTSITDAQGNTWGLDANAFILENGKQAYRGWQSHQMVYHNHSVFILGLDGNWYQWNGTAFVPGAKPL